MRTPLAALAALLALGGAAQAGIIFLPGSYADGRFTPAPAEPARTWQTLYSTTRATITEAAVQTVAQEILTGAGDFVGVMPLPDGAEGATVALLADGAPVPFQVLKAAQAQDLYAELARRTESSRLVAFAGRPAVLVPRIALGHRTRLEISLTLPVQSTGGLHDVRIPLPATASGAAPARRVTVEATVLASRPLRAVFSPTHDVEVDRPALKEARVRFSQDEVAEGDELRLLFAPDDDAVGLRVLTHRPEGDDHGYFLLLGNPTGGDGVAPAQKDLILALDISGSMRGEKLAQVQLAAEYVVEHLNPGDRFNLIAFGSEVQRFRDEVVAVDDASRADALRFLHGLLAVGKTNISEALRASLAGKAEAGRPRLVLFLTDGTPTVGELAPERILASVPEGGGTPIFALGVGHDVDAHLLDGLALKSGGRSLYLEPEDEIDVKVAALYDGLSHPVLTGVSLDFGGLAVDHLYPEAPTALFRGQEVLLAGRYTGGGAHTLTLKGTLRGAPQQHTVQVDFPQKPRPDDAFVAWLWASRRIGDLLREIRLEGQTQERVREVVELSLKYGILTEYTVFLSDAGRTFTPEEATAAAAELMETANAQSSGRWAVQQAGNELGLRHRKVSSVDNNFYKDRQGTVRKAEKVRTIDGRAYYQRDGKWVDAASRANKTRRVKKYSPEYFELIKKNKNFARAQSLGGDTVMDFEGERLETY
ncbi:MAG: VWA domain-containing protein [bacterium]